MLDSTHTLNNARMEKAGSIFEQTRNQNRIPQSI